MCPYITVGRNSMGNEKLVDIKLCSIFLSRWAMIVSLASIYTWGRHYFDIDDTFNWELFLSITAIGAFLMLVLILYRQPSSSSTCDDDMRPSRRR